MRWLPALVATLVAALVMATPQARASGDPAGQFDYYVLSLSWSADWCALEGDARHDPQCAPGRGLTFTLHGLWPQNERGYPSDCRTTERDPSPSQTAAMEDVMGSPTLAWHEWQKHGRCSGLAAADYLALARRAYRSVTIPPVFTHLNKTVTLPASVVEDAFVEANSGLSRDMITVTCDRGLIQEARICLTKTLQPRRCGADVAQDCRLPSAGMDPVR